MSDRIISVIKVEPCEYKLSPLNVIHLGESFLYKVNGSTGAIDKRFFVSAKNDTEDVILSEALAKSKDLLSRPNDFSQTPRMTNEA